MQSNNDEIEEFLKKRGKGLKIIKKELNKGEKERERNTKKIEVPYRKTKQ